MNSALTVMPEYLYIFIEMRVLVKFIKMVLETITCNKDTLRIVHE